MPSYCQNDQYRDDLVLVKVKKEQATEISVIKNFSTFKKTGNDQ